MTKEVLVSISGMQMFADDMESSDEPIEVLSPGIYYFKNGKHYVFLEEMAEGIPGVTKTQIKWKDAERLEVSKKGVSNVQMIFEKNKKNICFYHTPFGQLNLGIYMTEMRVEEQEDCINIRADYFLDVDYQPVADCSIRIRICSKGAKDFFLIL